MKNPITTTDSQEAFLQACELRGYDPETILPDVSKQPEWLQRYTHSSIKRLVIAEGINNGRVRKPGEETVYFPVWDLTDNSSGLGFARTGYDRWRTHTIVGPRLLLENSSNALYAIRTFPEEYKATMVFAKEGL